MPLRNVATTFTIEQQRLEINNLAGDVNNIATGVTNVGTAATANALAAGATGADLTLSGTLTVNGSQTILNTATLEVEDKNIIIAKGSTTDAAASGGGITLKGADDKTLLYNQTGDKWEFNKPLNVGGSAATAGSWGQTDWNLEVFDSAADCYTLLAGAAGAAIELRDTVTSEAFVIAANGDCNLYSYKSGDSMSFHTTDGNGTGKRLTITDGGDVKIGLDSVTTRTDSAHYGFNITGKSGTTGAGSIFFNDSADNCDANIAADNGVLMITADYSDNTAGSAIKFRVDGSSEKMVIDSSGNVGVGISVPTRKLDVRESGANDIATFINSDTTNGYGVNIKGGGTAANRYALRVANGADTECFKVKADGYVEFTGSNDLRVTLGSTGTAGENSSNWIRASGADFMYNAASGQHKWEIGGTEVATLTADKFQASQVWDGRGHLRRLSPVAPGGVYDVVAGDNGTQGRYVFTTNNVRLANGMTAGDMITIINNGGSDITIDAATNSVTLTNSADASTGDRTLASKGMATVLYVGSATAFISGAGLS